MMALSCWAKRAVSDLFSVGETGVEWPEILRFAQNDMRDGM